MGRSITPAATGAARLQFAQGLLDKIREMAPNEQLKFMQDLANQVNTPLTRAYGVLSANNKLAFWYQLAVWMEEGTVIPVPDYYKLSDAASNLFGKICSLEFNQQITLLRKIVVDMGIDPLA
jgi:methylase of polypeptide subunit release factors